MKKHEIHFIKPDRAVIIDLIVTMIPMITLFMRWIKPNVNGFSFVFGSPILSIISLVLLIAGCFLPLYWLEKLFYYLFTMVIFWIPLYIKAFFALDSVKSISKGYILSVLLVTVCAIVQAVRFANLPMRD